MKKQKYYVVWEGVKPGIYMSWDEAKAQVQGYPTAKYKSFEDLTEATNAFRGNFSNYINFAKNTHTPSVSSPKTLGSEPIIAESICVDAACSGNPGDMEYRCVYTKTREQLFHQGPFPQGTNNIGEFLALVHGLAMLKKEGKHNMPIYTDSKTAMAWVRNKKVKTELKKTKRNEKIFDLIERALLWLESNTYSNPIIKWETDIWGEIPADFGRK